MSELTKKRVHWTEYNGDELLYDEDVDVLTSADAVTFDDGEDLQYKYTQGQFVNPSVTGSLASLSTTNKSSLVDAINEVKTNATSNESSIGSLTERMSISETDIDNLEVRMDTAEIDIDKLEARMDTAESDIDSLETRMLTTDTEINELENRMDTAESGIDDLESRMNTAESGIDDLENRITPISLGGTGATTETSAISNFKTALVDLLYPVGSIHMSVNSANPSTYFGGTWVSWGAGRVPVGVKTSDSSFSTVEKTGGAKTHTLTIDEIPSHSHYLVATNYYVAEGGLEIAMDRDSTASGVYNTGETGGGKSHNNLQPYITCYMWKRTA